jgi:hypothetical protein
LRVRCSWAHCENAFEGTAPAGWKLVARHLTTGEQVVVCPEHYPELLAADLRALLKLFQGTEEPTRQLGRLLK